MMASIGAERRRSSVAHVAAHTPPEPATPEGRQPLGGAPAGGAESGAGVDCSREPAALAALRGLAVRARAGDRDAMAALLQTLSRLSRGAARREAHYARELGLQALIERADLAQDAQRILLELMADYDVGAGAPFPFFEIRLRAKLRQVVRQAARRRPAHRPLSWDDPAAAEMADRLSERLFGEAGHAGIAPDTQAAVRAAVGALALPLRRVVALVYWEDLTLPQAAARLRVSETAVRRYHRKALETLRSRLESSTTLL